MHEERKNDQRRKNALLFDIILILSLVVVSLSVFLIFKMTRKGGEYVQVTVNGSVVAEYPLYANGEYVLNGGTNVLIIKDGAAYMKEASCPDKTCITRHEHGISYEGESITCLPNRVRVEVVGGGL